MPNSLLYLLPLLLGLASAWSLIPVAVQLGLMDTPGGRKDHAVPTPLIGGVAIYLGTLLPILLVPGAWASYYPCLTLSLGLLVVGILDDRSGLPPKNRLCMQIFAALCMIFWGGIQLESLGDLFGFGLVQLGLLAVPFTIFATVGVINAINMVDGVDGLASGIALIALFYLGLAATLADRMDTLNFIVLHGGAMLAFWLLNFRFPWRQRAHVFMGDSGSTTIGFILVWLIIELSQTSPGAFSPVVGLSLLALPISDTIVLMAIRISRGESPFKAGRDHFHHRLLGAGFSTRKTVLAIYTLSALFGGVCLGLHKLGISDNVLFAGLLIAANLVQYASFRINRHTAHKPSTV